MGIDVNRFVSEVDDELICPICNDVLEDHYQISSCEHLFCAACIRPLIRENRVFSCPVDRKEVKAAELKQSRVINNILANLQLQCAEAGCSEVVKLGELAAHLKNCQSNLQQMVQCQHGCGLHVRRANLKEHNCISELCSELNLRDGRIERLTKQRDVLLDENLTLCSDNKTLHSLHAQHQAAAGGCEGAIGVDEEWEDLGTLVVCDCEDHRLPIAEAGCVTDKAAAKFEREAEFHTVDYFSWRSVAHGTLKIKEEAFGYRILMVTEDGDIVSSTTISIETECYLEDSSVAWTAFDLMCDPPAKRRLRATFTDIRHSQEFDKIFKEGKKHAERFHITEEG